MAEEELKEQFPFGVEERQKVMHLFIIGQAGNGKSSFCFHLTKNPDFKANTGFESVTKKCIRRTGNGFGCFDTIGYAHDIPSHEIQNDIIKSLEENNEELCDRLDAVCLIISLTDRAKIEEIKKEINKWSFISKSNLIIIYTNNDLAIKKRDYSQLKEKALEIAQNVLDEKFKEKTLFWTNDCPDDIDRVQRMKDPIQKKFYQDLVDKLKDGIKFCKVVEFNEIKNFIAKRKGIYEKTLWKVFKSQDLERKPKTLSILFKKLAPVGR